MSTWIPSRRVALALLAVLVAILVQISISVSPAHAQGGWPETPDETWATNGTVFDTDLSEDGSTLYIGGRFTVARENPPGEDGARVSVTNLAAIDVATGEIVRDWRPRASGGEAVVRSVEVEGNKVYIGGNFTDVNGEPRTHAAAVSTVDGMLDPGFAPKIESDDPAVSPVVYTILTSDSKVYIGGVFNFVDDKWRAKLAAFDAATGALDPDWDPRANREVFDLEFSSDEQTMFVIGRFRSLTGADGTATTRETVGRLHTDTGNVHPWAIPAGTIEDPQTGWEGLVTPTRLYAGFGDKGPNYVAAFRLDNGASGNRTWRRNVVGDVYALALTPDGSRLFFGGHFGINRLRQEACGRPVQGIASVNPANGQWLCDWIPPLQPEFNNGNGPWDMTIIGDNQLWVGGGFTHVSGVNQTNLARFTYDPNLTLVGQKNGLPAKPRTDDAKPTISQIRPGGRVQDKTPTVRAKIRDARTNLSKANIRLYVDGKRTNRFSYRRNTDRLAHTTKRLSRGWHRVKVVATDAAGNRAVKTWRFRVIR